jgi:1-acyl-sn-glycerol-3-phosphate acyltransferase
MPAIEFPRPFPIQFSGSPVVRWSLKRLGWHIHFEGLPTLQGMLVIYPHTSNWDFVILLAAKWAIGIPVSFWGKDKLFDIPLFGRWLRWLGGVPVNRTSPRGLVACAVEQFIKAKAQSHYYWLALSPEGTRKQIPGWRSGFYQTAVKADVPLCLVRLDYHLRKVELQHFVNLTGNVVDDFNRIASVYEGVTGYIPANAAPVRLLPPSVPRSETIVK